MHTIDGTPCYKDTTGLPGVPELAVIATPPDSVPSTLLSCATT